MGIELDNSPQFTKFAHPEKFVSAAWLSARLGVDGLKVVESDEDAYLYDIGHIPGAVRIDWSRDLNDAVIRDLIGGEAFAALMRERGISRDDTVVVYGDRANWWAAYTAWVFELFGHPDVRILDGGRDAWMGEERDTSPCLPTRQASIQWLSGWTLPCAVSPVICLTGHSAAGAGRASRSSTRARPSCSPVRYQPLRPDKVAHP